MPKTTLIAVASHKIGGQFGRVRFLVRRFLEGIFDYGGAEVFKGNPGGLSALRKEAGGGHSGQGVDF